LENILPELKKKALEEKAVFVRFDPPIKNLKENKNAFKKL
jgi:hypothetical protein